MDTSKKTHPLLSNTVPKQRRKARGSTPARTASTARPAHGKAEQHIYGWHAAEAIWRWRRQDIRRIYYHRKRADTLAEWLSWAAARHLPYRQLDSAALTRVTETPHHEGIVLVVNPLRLANFNRAAVGRYRRWVVLEEVSNPHNLGAILRSCGFFGVEALLQVPQSAGVKLNAAAQRVAQGGAECVRLFAHLEMHEALAWFEALGVPRVGLAVGAQRQLASQPLTAPLALILGNETQGLSTVARASCTQLLAIAGSGAVQSLNVASAATLAIAQAFGNDAPAP